jgi:hypothetical protein
MPNEESFSDQQVVDTKDTDSGTHTKCATPILNQQTDTHTIAHIQDVADKSIPGEHIRQHRIRLDAIKTELLAKQHALNTQHNSLKRKYDELYMKCDHPRDERSKTHGPYPQTEYWCPDCHREDVFG